MCIFKKKRSKYDQSEELITKHLVNRSRVIGKHNNCAPTEKTSDEKIIEIYRQVGSAFQDAARSKGEYIPAGYLNTIVFKFYQVYELGGDMQLSSYLEYEINKYLQSGLRPDYKRELKLF